MAFNQIEYINQYKKEHYVQVKVELTREQKQELINICNRQGISIKKFIVNSIERAKNDK